MPVVPSFTGFARTPNLAGAAAQGAETVQRGAQIRLQSREIDLRRQQIANQAMQAAQELSIQRQRIAAQERMANMEMQAAKEQQQQSNLMDMVKLDVNRAYQDARLGLEKMQLDLNAKKLMIDTQQAMQDPFKASGSMVDVGGSQVPVVEVERGRFVVPPAAYGRQGGNQTTVEQVPGMPGYVTVTPPGGTARVMQQQEPQSIIDARKEMAEIEKTATGVRTGDKPKLNRRLSDQWDAMKLRYDELEQKVEEFEGGSEQPPPPQMAPPPQSQQVPGPAQAEPADPYFGDVAGAPPDVSQGLYHAGTEFDYNEKKRERQKPRKVGNFEILSVR